jgi:DNA-binding protein HU-beta
MKKAEFNELVAEKSGLTKKDAGSAIDAMLESITECLAKKDTVSFIGFGTFSTSARAAREARVPGTDRVVDVPATTAVKFKVGASLKQAVSGK